MPGDARYLCTVYRRYVINVLDELEQNCVRVVPELGPQIHWSLDELSAGALCSMGDHSESLVEVKTYTTRRLLCSMMLGHRSKRRSQVLVS